MPNYKPQPGSSGQRAADDVTFVNLMKKASELVSLGQNAEAVLALDDAAKLQPHDSRVFVNRSFCYYNDEDYEASLDDARKAVKLDPNRGKCHYREGE